ncbi:oxidoreductase [Rhodococcus sp. ACPA4]|uniref:Isopenicillin N synthase-like dioxygenase n=1 Tax=Nocardia globerula TaxID=1818 RepID=A0A652YTZ8_NOCGL|nr:MULTISPECIES: 2-oxoglutarate and iron-dependent oxygenase domain-containing protein [Rhodococcus]MCE4264519.1 isopenicillin N synthase family oxygenase [Rhodococcus globerulus]NMD60911.1 isopenicillin N synthase family oxygenase [Nocardia globerula]PBC37502.1 oxidoreductase [Rhodococcus sp. ACPA4]PVX67541.1 isopenicillin N synthase-like dioxygenase [Rhodococcus globerulus]
MSTRLPLLDLTPWYDGNSEQIDALLAEVDRCLRESGFLLITGHRVPPELRSATREAAREFFHSGDTVKESVAAASYRGWVRNGDEATGLASGEDVHPDVKESYNIGRHPAGPHAHLPNNLWPSDPSFRTAMETYYAEVLRLGDDLLQLFSRTLGLPENYLGDMATEPPSQLTLNWYPAIDRIGTPDPSRFRIGPHTDYGCVTILDREPGRAGLQICTLEGEWVDAPVYPDAYTINIGDLLARLTGDRWRSTRHRVLPPDPSSPSEELISLAFFHEFDDHAEIQTLAKPYGGGTDYELVNAGAYVQEKLDSVILA